VSTDIPAPTSSAGFLNRISTDLPQLRRSEQKVAQVVLENPEKILHETASSLARRAAVSEPTVARFALGLGFDGYQDFRMQLAQSLALGIPATQSSITESDDASVAVDKIFSYAVTSLAHAREHLDAKALEDAANLVVAGSEIIFLGVGASGIVAQDAQQKFPLFMKPTSAPADQQMLLWAGAMAKPGTVVVAISNSGRTASVVQATIEAKSRGATTVAITGNAGPLSEAVDVAIIVETFENTDFFTPTTSRLAHLTAIDALATLVALRNTDEEKKWGRQTKVRLALQLTDDS
jgi:RpiR family carbohydrate utilization transcriptional regulator